MKTSKNQNKVQARVGRYTIIQTLGQGGTAKVKLGFDGQNYFAIKIFKQSYLEKSKNAVYDIVKELQIMQNLTHERLLRFYEILQNETYTKKSQKTIQVLALVIEYAKGGEIYDYIALTGGFQENIARTYFTQLMRGILYIHGNGVAHRDLKLENVLLDANFDLKIADFGFSGLLSGANSTGKMKTICGTPGYYAPEIMKKEAYSGASVDFFNCGILLFQFVHGYTPFNQATDSCQYYKNIINGQHDKFWNEHQKRKAITITPELKDLLNLLFSPDPKNRPTISEILSHPWMKGPSIPISQIKDKLEELKNMVESKNKIEKLNKQKKKQELSKLQQNKQQQQQNNTQQQENGKPPQQAEEGTSQSAVYRGFNKFRSTFSSKEENFEGIDQISENINNKREITEYEREARNINDILVEQNKDNLLKILILNLKKRNIDFQLHDSKYKIKVTIPDVNQDETQEIKLIVQFFYKAEDEIYVNFQKLNGLHSDYHEFIEEIKNIITINNCD